MKPNDRPPAARTESPRADPSIAEAPAAGDLAPRQAPDPAVPEGDAAAPPRRLRDRLRERTALAILAGALVLTVVALPGQFQRVGTVLAGVFGHDEVVVAPFDDVVVQPVDDAPFADFTPGDLVQLRIHDIDADYVRAMRRLVPGIPVSDIVQLHIHDVEPDFVRAMHALGFDAMPVGDLVQLGIHDIEPAFVRAMREAGYAGMPVAELVQFAIHDVEPGFIREMHDLGYDDLSTQELVQMAIHGVDSDYARRLLAR